MIIPGLILFTLLFLFPYSIVLKDKRLSGFTEAFRFGKQHFLGLLGLVILVQGTELVLGILVALGVDSVTNSFMIHALV